MKKALIIGSSGGIGAAICENLTEHGVTVDRLSRDETGFDLTDPAGIEGALSGLTGPYDLMLIATGALVIKGQGPEKTIKAVTQSAMMAQFAVNAVGPALILQHAARLLPKDRRSVVAALSAKVGSIGDNRLGGWTSYRASKTALNQIIKTTSIELARSHPKAACIALHPGTVATEFTKDYVGRHAMVDPMTAAHRLLDVTGKIKPTDTGGFYDYSGAPLAW